MKLDRNLSEERKGKYALIKLRDVHTLSNNGEKFTIWPAKAVDFGSTEDTDFFVIRLKDKYAFSALMAYANAAREDDPEYAEDILALAVKARHHPNQRKPD